MERDDIDVNIGNNLGHNVYDMFLKYLTHIYEVLQVAGLSLQLIGMLFAGLFVVMIILIALAIEKIRRRFF